MNGYPRRVAMRDQNWLRLAEHKTVTRCSGNVPKPVIHRVAVMHAHLRDFSPRITSAVSLRATERYRYTTRLSWITAQALRMLAPNRWIRSPFILMPVKNGPNRDCRFFAYGPNTMRGLPVKRKGVTGRHFIVDKSYLHA